MTFEPASMLLLRRRHGALALTLVLVLAVCSCSRQVPSAPSSAAGQGRPTGSNSTNDLDNTEGEVMTTLEAGVNPTAFGQEYGAQLVGTTEWGGSAYEPGGVESPESLADRMSLDPRVITSEPNAYIETPEARQQSLAFDDGVGSPQACADQPAMSSVDLYSALGVSIGSGVRVAILDTGAEPTHPALAGRIAGGWDFIGGDADPTDQPDGLDNDLDGLIDEARGHGTHVAGTVARMAPGASLLVVRVLDADGRGDILGVASGIRWAIDHGARVINMSLGMLRTSPAIENLLAEAEQRGIVVVVSAGNWGSDTPTEFPASSDHVLAIAATGVDGRAASFTSRGSFVALCAPGVAIRSAYFGGRYAMWSGTSMAAPFVSGTAALLLALHPSWNRLQTLDRLAASARPLDEEMAGELGAGGLVTGAALAPDRAGAEPTREPIPLLR
jgi:subtilisin family serine protease